MDRQSSPHRRHRQSRVLNSSPYYKRPSSSRPAARFTHTPRTHAGAHTRIASVNHKADDINAMRIFHDYTDAINDATFVEHASDIAGDTDPENSSFHWEEETTLFAELMDDGPYQTEEDRLDELVNSLQEPLTELGTQAKRNIASTLVGTINHVRKTLGLIDDNVDPYYGKGLHLFKKGSTAIEATCHARETQIKEIHEMTQQKITILLDELKAEHEFRDKLWAKLKASINEIMNPVLETIKDAPALTEHTIVKLDKQLENEDSKAVNPTQKLLQQLLMRGA